MLHKKHIEQSLSISGTLDITVSGGGEDARIKWKKVLHTDWLPKRITLLFQCKATPLGLIAISSHIERRAQQEKTSDFMRNDNNL